MFPTDEGYTDDDLNSPLSESGGHQGGGGLIGTRSVREREELAFSILASLPRSSLAVLQARIAPLLKLDIVGVSTSLHSERCVLADPGATTIISGSKAFDSVKGTLHRSVIRVLASPMAHSLRK
ncbi:hypothetical protein OH77DRAFT_925629 [Trametes cingulata]|nr:hypothetical protein OH77DRAFT_925629 [Trametes cingulata]